MIVPISGVVQAPSRGCGVNGLIVVERCRQRWKRMRVLVQKPSVGVKEKGRGGRGGGGGGGQVLLSVVRASIVNPWCEHIDACIVTTLSWLLA